MEQAIAVDKEILQLVTFELFEEFFAIDINYVQEIIRVQEITDVPHTDEHIQGVINLRGHIIPVIDLKVKFGLAEKNRTKETRIIVVSIGNLVVGMIVDAVSEVIRLDATLIEPPSPVISSIDSDYLKGVGKHGEKMILLLDIEKILNMNSGPKELSVPLIGSIED